MNEAEFIENTDYLDAEYLEYAENVSTASTEDYNNNMDEAGFIENTDYFDTRYLEYAENVSTASTEYYNNNMNGAEYIEYAENVSAASTEYRNNNMNDNENIENTGHFDDENTENRATTSQVASFIGSAESDASMLFSGKVFSNWVICDSFIVEWDKNQGFNVVKDRVDHENNIIRRRTYVCQHARHYGSNSNKETGTKKMRCSWHVNASCPKHKNLNSAVFINTIVNEHNHELNVDAIMFEHEKKFSKEIMNNNEFLTQHCRIGATTQRRYLEGKYPAQPIYNNDLYAAISKFRPTTNHLLNDATQMSNWLDTQKEKDPRWVVARGWDDDNTLTYLMWITPTQSEIVVSDTEEDDIDNSKATIRQLLDVVEQDN
ncbi:6369_t:CDS:2, partial [Gigaspora rosea]